MFCCLAAARFLAVRFWVVLDCVVGYCGIYVVLHFLVVCAGGCLRCFSLGVFTGCLLFVLVSCLICCS